ncbi:MAG TPA: helix-turn-helix transcriptional regulator, partial [Bradyrhizobium sp.]|nr:helix-turn-helix transcriptional regulator [Bradyrhizobium sp.]
MSQQENLVTDSPFSKWTEGNELIGSDDLEVVRLSTARTKAMDEAGAAIARQLNGPLTALLLYMGEIKQHSHQLTQTDGNRAYLQQVVENALQQTERVCAMMKQIA